MKDTIHLFCLIFIFVNTCFAQEDSTLVETSTPAVEDCETVAINSQKQLNSLEFNEIDKINQQLNSWEAACGEVEPIQRIRILIAIQQRYLSRSHYNDYLVNQIEKYKDRIITAGESDYQKVFEEHDGYFSYVPLKGAFDAKTKEIAKQLLVDQEEGSAAHALALLFSEKINKFEDEIASEGHSLQAYAEQKEYEGDDEWDGTARIGLELGWWMPDQKLSAFFSSSPYLGFKLGGSINDVWSVELNAALMFLINDDDYRVNIADSIQYTDSDLIFSITADIVRTQKLGKRFYLDGSAGIGISGMNTDIPLEEPEEDNEYNTLFTFDFNVGLVVRSRLKNGHTLGLATTYHYAPFGLDNRLVDVFGNQSLRVGVVYLFE